MSNATNRRESQNYALVDSVSDMVIALAKEQMPALCRTWDVGEFDAKGKMRVDQYEVEVYLVFDEREYGMSFTISRLVPSADYNHVLAQLYARVRGFYLDRADEKVIGNLHREDAAFLFELLEERYIQVETPLERYLRWEMEAMGQPTPTSPIKMIPIDDPRLGRLEDFRLITIIGAGPSKTVHLNNDGARIAYKLRNKVKK
jgi:hypothetical protein